MTDQGKAHVQLTFKNYGRVPLNMSSYQIELIATGDPQKLAYHESFASPGTSVVLPSEEAKFQCALSPTWLFEIIASGDAELVVKVVMNYTDVQADRQYQFRSKHRYKPDQHIFEVFNSSMT